MMESRPQLAHFLLRLGLAFVLVYFGIDKAIHPDNWLAWIPASILGVLPLTPQLFLLIQGVIETIMGVILLFGFLVRPVAVLTAILLISIVAFWGLNEITTRDMGLLGAVLYLFFQPEAETTL